MDKLQMVSAIVFAFIFMIPQGAASAAAPSAAAATVPGAGAWSGTTKLGYPVYFTINTPGTSWSAFFLYTKVTFSNGCSAVVTANLSGPGPISTNVFGGAGGGFKFTGQLASTTTATGTYTFTNYQVAGCDNKLFSQTGTWTAKAPLAPPGAFAKASPVKGAMNTAVQPTLSWNASARAAKYETCLDTVPHAVNDTLCGSTWVNRGTARSVTLAKALAENTTYYWQVRATNASGTVYANAGTWWSFTTGTLPVAFGKSSPTNGATGQALASTLSWVAATGAASYQYCFDTVNNSACDTAWASAGAATTVDPPGVFLPGKTYYWQVRAVNSAGMTYADGNTWWSFRTVPPKVLTLRSAAVLDGWVLELGENSGTGGTMNPTATVFYLGDDARNRQYRSILSFGTSAIPAKAVITGVTLRINKQGGSPVSPFATLGGIVVDIRKGPFGLAGLQLLDFKATASKTGALTIGSTPAPVGGWYAKALGPALFPYINRTGVTQFRLRFAKDDNNNRVANYLAFYSGNAALANRPQLVIQYYVP